VSVPPEMDRLPLINVLRHYLPHLLALSSSSPYFEAADTGFDSFRSIMWRRWPNSGIPPRFASHAEFASYVDTLLGAGVMADPWNLYWSMRPHPKYPTVEFRVTDVCPSVHDAAAIAALARALVRATATGRLKDDAVGMSEGLEQELLRINEWRVARDGLTAQLIDARTGGHEPVRTSIRRLLDTVAPDAEALGDVAAFADLERLLERGNAADRMRQQYEERGTFTALVRWLMDETRIGTGLDRRSAQRVDG
jgi:glutamate---cysteine ligase / carboxylate-amine ligase